ncbi:hypothetical protein [Rhodoligotrophos defluvii]|uniref:hypothetical protein n=1 Tax=Rhodoligotrophos defluvii TaxID=2561934 RepID=UPI0010C9E434|nr:hypothetical protein [Rhodoligotrophos defluvii]
MARKAAPVKSMETIVVFQDASGSRRLVLPGDVEIHRSLGYLSFKRGATSLLLIPDHRFISAECVEVTE